MGTYGMSPKHGYMSQEDICAQIFRRTYCEQRTDRVQCLDRSLAAANGAGAMGLKRPAERFVAVERLPCLPNPGHKEHDK